MIPDAAEIQKALCNDKLILRLNGITFSLPKTEALLSELGELVTNAVLYLTGVSYGLAEAQRITMKLMEEYVPSSTEYKCLQRINGFLVYTRGAGLLPPTGDSESKAG